MSAAREPLPEPTDDVERQVLGDIARHGWHVVLVRRGVHEHEGPGPWPDDPATQAAYEAEFSYTAGLTYTSGIGRWSWSAAGSTHTPT